MEERVDGRTRRQMQRTPGRNVREGTRCPTADPPLTTPLGQLQVYLNTQSLIPYIIPYTNTFYTFVPVEYINTISKKSQTDVLMCYRNGKIFLTNNNLDRFTVISIQQPRFKWQQLVTNETSDLMKASCKYDEVCN